MTTKRPQFVPTHILTVPGKPQPVPVCLMPAGGAYTRQEWEAGKGEDETLFGFDGKAWHMDGLAFEGEVKRTQRRPRRYPDAAAVPMSVRLHPDVRARILAAANKRGIPAGELITKLVEDL